MVWERAMFVSLVGQREIDTYLVRVEVGGKWKDSSTVLRKRKSMWPQTGW